MLPKVIGIDPGLTATGIVIARQEKRNLLVFRHAVFAAEGNNWYEKCDGLAHRIKSWILTNTNDYDMLSVMIEEPINMMQSRAWSAAVQNRLLSAIVHEVSDIGLEKRVVKIQTIVPVTMKKIFTGSGKSDKDSVIEKAEKMYHFRPHWPIKFKEAIADAIGIAYCCYMLGNEEGVGVTNL